MGAGTVTENAFDGTDGDHVFVANATDRVDRVGPFLKRDVAEVRGHRRTA